MGDDEIIMKEIVSKTLTRQEFRFISIVAVLVSVVSIWFIVGSFSEELGLAPSLGGPSSSTRVVGQVGVGEIPIGEPSGGSLIWSYSNGPAKPVSMGNNGERVFSSHVFDSDLLFSSSDPNNPPNSITNTAGCNPCWSSAVASAKNADVHAIIDPIQVSPGLSIPQIRKFSSASSTPEWIYDFSQVGIFNGPSIIDIEISDDGNRIVAYYQSGSSTRFITFSPNANNGNPVIIDDVFVSTFGSNPTSEDYFSLSGDGKTAIYLTSFYVYIIDLTNGNKMYEYPYYSYEGFYYGASAISFDGSRAAYGTFVNGAPAKVTILDKQGGGNTYAPVETITLPTTDTRMDSLDISDNGFTLVGGYHIPEGLFGVSSWNIENIPGGVIPLMNYERNGGGYNNRAIKIKLSSDSSRFAVGLWGEKSGQIPQVQVFPINQNNPTFTYKTDGSVEGLGFSSDGKKLVVSSDNCHLNHGTDPCGSFQGIDLFQIN